MSTRGNRTGTRRTPARRRIATRPRQSRRERAARSRRTTSTTTSAGRRAGLREQSSRTTAAFSRSRLRPGRRDSVAPLPASAHAERPRAAGERVYIPRRGEAPPPDASAGGGGGGGSSGSAGGKININMASESELESLPGIGPTLAQRIVDYRAQHGPFHDVKDLLKVEGI